MAQTLANYAGLLKEWYTSDKVATLGYQDNPFFAMCAKNTSFYGDVLNVPIVYGFTTHSATFANAVTYKGNSQNTAFLLTRVSDYSLASIGREVMLASSNDKGAFMQAAKTNIDGAIHSITRSLAIAMFRSNTGSIGRISAGSTVASDTITLMDINDISNFEVGQVLQTAATDGGAARTGVETIAGVNRDLGTLLATSANWDDVMTAVAASDWIYNVGDRNAKMSGLANWLPATAPAATAYFGVDRTADVTRLGGVRYDGSSVSIEEALVNGQSKVAREGGSVDVCIMNNVHYRNLINALQSKVQYVDMKSENGAIGFQAVQIMGDKGPIKVIADHNCPAQVAYMLTSKTWKLNSLQGAPHIFDADNDQKMLREATVDAVELRCGYYAQLGCNAPGHNGRVTLPAAT